ncbi:glycosyltransferase family 2 protein [Lelliottia wanjuensis]|uniref:glycosyltransferase family 2 protein n=1 Tax=Lelliottia wanjuensis TaxID=3050585 RepID=UPI00254EAFD0|nr:glycosyltransferase family 2 protein [Lelliottia sp. V104_15]MDK9606491.1 glycosyltransferase family 2 protein [Lelliottia sp. V104_15]
MPLISIITVVYNDYNGLKQTLSSVEEQSRKDDFEHVIIDGHSTDNTLSLIKNNANISRYISEKDDGIYDAMNKGINLSTGKWIIFLNAGDVFYNKNVIKNVLEHLLGIPDDINFVFGQCLCNDVKYDQNLSIKYLTSHMINHQSIFYKRELFNESLYSTSYRYCADYKHLLDNYSKIRFRKLNFIVSIFDGTGISSQVSNKYKMWIERLKAVWGTHLPIITKVQLSQRGILSLPYQYIRAKLITK